MRGTVLKLDRNWIVEDRIGSGGFGQVWSVSAGASTAAAKLIPKAPGAARELLFVDLEDARKVVPIIDHGEHDEFWVIVMPRAECSLRDYIESAGATAVDEALPILADIADALSDLDGRVVHRDIKPENVLLLDGSWCLADFGISRYAEATTAPDTQKYALSPPYAAPERWRAERATSATDVYAAGIIAYELLAGRPPFAGPGISDYREQHLHEQPASLGQLPSLLEALISECLYKAPEARPRAANMAARLRQAEDAHASGGLGRLQQANRDEVQRRAEGARERSAAQTEAERLRALGDAAEQSFARISQRLREALTDAAPAASVATKPESGWQLRLGPAQLEMSGMSRVRTVDPWGGRVQIKVIATSDIGLTAGGSYGGRSHSLWFGDVQEPDEFAWFESAFMHSPLLARSARQEPFALAPGPESAEELGPGLGAYQVAWPFTRLVIGQLGELIDRWAEWFAHAAQGALSHPTRMPEREPAGSWRR